MIERRHGDVKKSLEREVRLKSRQRSLGIRDEADLDAGRVQRAQHLGHLFIHLEVMTGCPLIVDVAGRVEHAWTTAAHPLDDALGVANEDLGVVDAALSDLRFERDRCDGHRTIERTGIHGHAVGGAEIPITHTLKRGARLNQREIDVEEHCAGGAPGLRGALGRHTCDTLSAAGGPAIAITARSGWRTSEAAAVTSSIVTARIRSGRRWS